ncbi:MAG: hypothetical protein M3Q87_00205 [Actinomycetota bacterium]|nr:hypothetical protein [Actinomycetota bacterium]
MSEPEREVALRDRTARTASAADQIAKIAAEGGLTHGVSDIGHCLRTSCPAPATEGVAGRRNITAQVAQDILAAAQNAGEDQA